MSVFPPSTNADYRGSKIAAWYLTLAAVLELAPGFIHYFLPDGGAGVIAHMDLSERRETIITMFAWFGALQIPSALLLLVISLRYRTLVPLGLLAIIVERALMTLDGWFLKGAGGHHPPEHFASPVSVALGLVFLVFSLTPRRSRETGS